MKGFFVSPNGFPAREQFPKTVPFTKPRGCRCDANSLLLQRCRGARHTARVHDQGDPVYPEAPEDLRAESRIFVGGSGFFLRPDHVFRYPRLSQQFPHRNRTGESPPACPPAACQHRCGPDLPVNPGGIRAALDSFEIRLRERPLMERRRNAGTKNDDGLQPGCRTERPNRISRFQWARQQPLHGRPPAQDQSHDPRDKQSSSIAPPQVCESDESDHGKHEEKGLGVGHAAFVPSGA